MGRKFEVRKVAMAKTATAKTKVYSKYGKEIYVVAKNGGTDPVANLSLKRLIEKAKKDQVPAHVIDKAIDKAAGGGGEDFAPARYEGFGPGGCMVIVDCLTDNVNRTITDVRNCFTKTDSKLGAQNSAAFMFDHLAVFTFAGDDDEVILEALMEDDVDVHDVEVEDGQVTVLVPHTEFFKAKTSLQERFDGIEFDVEEITWLPQESKDISEDDMPMFEKFMDMLNDCDDVQNVYHNANA
ncbi:YebC/PmpR family DNA-binding transcriptional regulator [Glaciecola sp. XM2]|jgi:YebC/PmpR family DNA-binding regulatory protein|uniref:YebC/PmpR family DNA-binding transcriptional regulator n=1 Tax=Glaciecola sp. XM2 TaxID=1914931 RepID=UPI001BDE06FD|nr:YebC/PmpR family DNA-binding transcriptional regulator [Glaciecola sp. XM2]MBT1452468.1 YebC/PmpR family DNA-binding transcriptional regulator [Glaciecola sp. XM2]